VNTPLIAGRPLVHGKSFALYKRGCRCEKCRAYHNGRVAASRAARRKNVKVHGIRSSYDAGCRCEACRGARREAYQRLASEGAGARQGRG
jgi:hypothetical protein